MLVLPTPPTVISSHHIDHIMLQQQASTTPTGGLAGISSSHPATHTVPRRAGRGVVAGHREPSCAVDVGAAATVHGRACDQEHLRQAGQEAVWLLLLCL
jgi:hypothetical protein